jgi:hypothetical protein
LPYTHSYQKNDGVGADSAELIRLGNVSLADVLGRRGPWDHSAGEAGDYSDWRALISSRQAFSY